MKYKDTGFRAIYNHFCVVELNDEIKGFLKDLPGGNEANAVITYGYYDREAGLTLEVMGAAIIGDNRFMSAPPNPDVSFKIRVKTLGDTEFNVVNDNDGRFTAKYADKLEMLSEYEVSNDIEMTREFGFLDSSRDEFFIDDVRVYMVKMELENEPCWVRITGAEDDTLIGELLNEPVQDFGYHKGDEIPFFVHKTEEGEIVCVSDLIPTYVYKAEDLEDGSMLKNAIERFAEQTNEYNFVDILSILRDSYVWVPCNTILSETDQAKLDKMVEEVGDNLDNLIDQVFVNEDNIRLVPDILYRGEDNYFPVFSSEEEMGDYGKDFSKIAKHFLEVITLARNNEKNVKGIVVNAFGTGFILERQFFDMVEQMESRIQE